MLTVEMTSIAGVEQFLDVLPALLVARTGHVGVRELVDQGDLAAAGEHRVQVHLLEGGAAVGEPGPRAPPPGPSISALVCGRPCVSDEAHDHVGAPLGPPVPLAEHHA